MPHRHKVEDADMSFRIDADTRAIINQSPVRKKLIQYDHKSERFTFEIPKTVDYHDMSLCDTIEIHFMNVGSNTNEVSADVYVVDDMHVSEDGKSVIFTWLIARSATRYAGTLTFMIRFLCHNEDLIVYSWGTDMYKGILIGDAYNNSDTSLSDDLREVTSVPRMSYLDAEAIAENTNRPFSIELHQALIDRDRVYIEDGGNTGVSPLYYLSANADAQFNPWGYESISAMCEDYVNYKWTPETVVKDTHYTEATVDGKTTYHPRLFSVVARMHDGSVRGTTNDKSSDDTLTNKGFVTGKLSLKIDKNSISASDTTLHRDQDKVLYRAKNGGNYSGIPVAVESVVNAQGVAAKSIPRFNANSELMGSTRNTSSDGTEEKDENGTVIGYSNGSLVNLGYAKKLINGAIKDHNHDTKYAPKSTDPNGYANAGHEHDDDYASKTDFNKYSFANFANKTNTDTDANAKNGYHVLSFGDKAKSLYAVRVDGSSSIASSIAQRLSDSTLRAKMRLNTTVPFATTYDADTLINYEYLNHRLSSYTDAKFAPTGVAEIPQRSAAGEIMCKVPTDENGAYDAENCTAINKEYLDHRLTAIPTDDHIKDLINTTIGGIVDGTVKF